jgi:hypothetical protein
MIKILFIKCMGGLYRIMGTFYGTGWSSSDGWDESNEGWMPSSQGC